MALLKIEFGVGAGTSFTVDNEAMLGRDHDRVTIPIMDQKASRTHAQIIKKDGGFYIKDLDSRNGTTVNGKPVQGMTPLEPGDYIRIGLTWLSFDENLDIEKIAHEIKEYQIIERIEDGWAALTFKARQVDLDRCINLTVLPPNIIKAHPHLTKKFQQLVRLLAKLSHENINIILDAGVKESYLYITTEYVDGVSLTSLLNSKPGRPIPLLQALEISLGVAKGLTHAHAKDMTHQDIKPLNIIISNHRVIIRGFGIAAFLAEVTGGDELSKVGISGTSEYLSPEQIQNKPVDFRTDIYSLGVIMYEMFTGHVPFCGSSPYETLSLHVSKLPPSVKDESPNIPPDVADIIHKCLEKEPDKRPHSCQKIVDVLYHAFTQSNLIQLVKSQNRVSLRIYYFFIRLIEQEWILWILSAIFAVTSLIMIKIFLG